MILGLILLFSSFFMVDQKEEAVVLNLGKFSRMVGPGLHFKIPFGVEKNYNVPTQRILKEEFGFRTLESGHRLDVLQRRTSPSESIMLTGDLNIIDVEWIIQYQITDARAWLFNVEDQHKTIRDISQSVINMLVGDRTIFDVIGAERANIEVQGQELMNELYKSYGLGITGHHGEAAEHRPAQGRGAGRLRGREQGHPGPEPPDQRGQGGLQPGHPQGQRPGATRPSRRRRATPPSA